MSVLPRIVSGVGRRRLVPLMRMDSFEVGEHDVSVECVMVVKSGVLDHGVRDGVFVLADELASTARARLFVGHGSHPFSAVGAFERDVDEMDRCRQHFVVVLLGVRGVLIQSEVDGNRLDDDAIFASVKMLLPAGVETTYRSLGNLLVGLLTHTDQLHALQHDRALIGAAIEEGLRWQTPFPRGAARQGGRVLGVLQFVGFEASRSCTHDEFALTKAVTSRIAERSKPSPRRTS